MRFGGVIGVGEEGRFGWGASSGGGCGDVLILIIPARRTGSSPTGSSIGVAAPRAAAAAKVGQIGPNFRAEHSTSPSGIRWGRGGKHVVIAGGHGRNESRVMQSIPNRPPADRQLLLHSFD